MKSQNALSLTILAAFLYMVIPGETLAQTGVSGIVTDEEGSPLPSATVLVLSPADSSLVKGGITNERGRYHLQNLEPGTYILSVSMVGFRQHHTGEFALLKEETLQQERIQLGESVEQLGAVSVTARKPLFEQKIDRLVVNVQRNITSSGKSALEVLEKSPGVLINRQSNSISLNGKTGVRVMINDKIVRLPIDAVVQMLDGMSAANIEQIELITTPPAKYEAEGDAGLINIKMKQANDLGTMGSVGGNIGYNWAETVGGNLNITHRSKKVALFLNYSINYDRNEHSVIFEQLRDDSNFTSRLISESQRRPTIDVQNARAGMEYSLSPKTNVGVLLTGYRRLWKTNNLVDITNHPAPSLSVDTEMAIQETNHWRRSLINASIDHSFNEDQTLSADIDYLSYKNDNPSFYNNRFLKGERSLMETEAIDVEKETPINIWVARLDYRHQLSESFTLETGIKGTLSKFVNDVHVSKKSDNRWQIDNRFTNKADLSENLGGVYLAGEWSLNKNLSINGGLRFEYTDSYLSTPEQQGLIDREFGNIFPSLFIKKVLTNDNSIQASYSRRINRPTFNQMAPFVFFYNTRTFVSGNPEIQPSITDAFKFDYQYKHGLISLEYSNSKDAIGTYQPVTDSDTNTFSYIAQNLEYLQNYSISVNVPIALTPWFEIQANASGRYQSFKTTHLEGNISREVSAITGNITNTIELPSDFSLEIAGFYESKSIWGLQEFRPRGSFDVGVQKRFADGQGVLRLTMSDVLYTSVWQTDVEVPTDNLDSYFMYDWHVQAVNLTFTWNFGNNELKGVSVESGSKEEQGRVNTD